MKREHLNASKGGAQKETNHMDPQIPTTTHSTAKKTEDESLPWYLLNNIVDPYTGAILQYKDLMQPKQKNRALEKWFVKGIWSDCIQIYRKNQKGTNIICFVVHNNIPIGHKFTYLCIILDMQPDK